MKKFLKFGFIGLNIASMCVGLVLVYTSTVGAESPIIREENEIKRLEAARDKRDETPYVYTMDKFTVNLDGYPRRIVQAEVNLELLDKTGYEQVIRLGSKGRDAIVRILNSKQFDEIETLQGKLRLKEQISTTLNDLMVEGVVKNVYFTELIVK
jgi:flagellar FliL protein